MPYNWEVRANINTGEIGQIHAQKRHSYGDCVATWRGKMPYRSMSHMTAWLVACSKAHELVHIKAVPHIYLCTCHLLSSIICCYPIITTILSGIAYGTLSSYIHIKPFISGPWLCSSISRGKQAATQRNQTRPLLDKSRGRMDGHLCGCAECAG